MNETVAERPPIESQSPEFFFLRAGLKDEYALGASLFQLYVRTVRENLWTLALPGFPDGSLKEFVKLYDSPWTVAAVDPETKSWIGYGTVFDVFGNPPDKRGTISYCFFRAFHGSRILRECAAKAISVWFNQGELSVLYGAALNSNSLAKTFAKGFGFKQSEILPRFFPNRPGEEGDAVMLYLTRSKWESLRQLI